MRLSRYLARVGIAEVLEPTRESLARLLRAHVLSVPFENLDVQLGVPTNTDVRSAYDKIVERGRGGWCYEQNGLFGWALETLGFDVTRIAAAVMRHERGSAADANHLCLLVRVPESGERALLSDVGFGGSLVAPLELAETTQNHAPYRVGLRRVDGRWRFFEDSGDGELSFDFEASPGNEDRLAAKCQDLQTDPDSSFVQSLVAQQRHQYAHVVLRGRVLKRIDRDGRESRTLGSADELVATLADEFALDVPEAAGLWPRIVARHDALFPVESEDTR